MTSWKNEGTIYHPLISWPAGQFFTFDSTSLARVWPLNDSLEVIATSDAEGTGPVIVRLVDVVAVVTVDKVVVIDMSLVVV